MIKLVVMIYKKPGLTREQFNDRWLNGHGPLVRKHADAMRIKKYIQTHYRAAPDIEAILAERGWVARCDAVTETWWDSLDEMRAALASPEGQLANAELAIDEAVFCDMDKMEAFMSHEEVILDKTGGAR